MTSGSFSARLLIQEQVPRKQGLKLRTTTKSHFHNAIIQEQVPRKQGLKHQPSRFGHRLYQLNSRASSTKTRIETHLYSPQ